MDIMKAALVLTLAFVLQSACADQVIHLPGGGNCFMTETGHVFGCSGVPSPQGAASPQGDSRIQEARNERYRQEALRKCLRKADMPGQPGRDECMYTWGP